jgi:hypothetical protein
MDTLGLFAGVALVSLVMSFNVVIYVSYTKLSDIRSRLENCLLIRGSGASFRSMGFGGRVAMLYLISLMFLFDQYCARRGLASLTDVARFPAPLKRWIQIPVGITLMSMLVMIIVWSVIVACGV